MNSKPGVVILCCDGLYQRHLIKRVAQECRLLGIVLQIDTSLRGSLWSRITRYLQPVELAHYLMARADSYRNRKKLDQVLDELFYEKGTPPRMPVNCPGLTGNDVNDPKAVKFVHELKPDLICVNGTRLLRKPMLDLIPILNYGIINLHTGLSPYARGGNCNLFVLLEGLPEWVGITIHHIDAGIDSGDIILTDQVQVKPDDIYQIIDARTFHAGIELMIKAIKQTVAGKAQRVKQWTEGKLFLRRTGYVYKPYQVYKVNKLIRRGLLRDYLHRRPEVDANVRLVKE